MKIYIPCYNNGGMWSDNYEGIDDVAFKTREGSADWIKSRGYVNFDDKRHMYRLPKRISEKNHDYSFYTIREVELK